MFFTLIQKKERDSTALRYMTANSDEFHVTPYGYCVNSFQMNPCANYLTCLDRYKNSAASGRNEHRVTLESLRAKLVEMRATASGTNCREVATLAGRAVGREVDKHGRA